MIYFLAKILNINFFLYITTRVALAFFMSLFLTLFLMPKFIKWAKSKKANQPIYELAPDSHKKKCDTPTMGGIIFIGSVLISCMFWTNLSNIFVICGIITLGAFCYLGYKDDILKIEGKKNHAGLSAKKKFIFQILISLIISLILYLFSPLNSELYFPFIKHPIFDMKFFAILFWILVITASSNAVNLTDGLDGLATIPSVCAFTTILFFAYFCGHAEYSKYLFLPKIVGVGEICIIISALIGSLLGFLWFNCYPAEVFMGDSGSLSIGAFLGYSAVITKNEILLILIGLIFVIETLSVILQVLSFRLFNKRIFLMAPIHHHFEIKGWKENKIIIRFWIIAIVVNILALTSLKLR